ncbi:MAG: alginate O-acetyltransferase AlgX-related protein [Bacteroidota bacterium]
MLILLPTLNNYLHLIKEEKGNENRTKFQKPDFDVTRLDAYVKECDNYYTDNFNLRENAIKLHNKFEYSFFGVSPVPDLVVVGKNGWFYDKNNTENYKGANLFSDKEMVKLKEELVTRTKWAEDKNIKYYVAVVPSKMNVYPEYLPDKVIKVSTVTRYDQIISLNNEPTINIIDLRKILSEHKNENYNLYQHTDGHWNDLGAYYGHQEIINRISKTFPDLKPFPLSDYIINVEQRPGGSLVSMINLEKQYPEQFVKLTEKNKIYAVDGTKRNYEIPKTVPAWEHQIIKVNDNGKKLKCLVIRDSFTLLMIRYFQEYFKETVFIHDDWKYRMREDIIVKEKPDIVLTIIFETEIGKLIEYPFNKNKN